MKSLLTPGRRLLVALLLGLVAPLAVAQSLGQPQGGTWIGQPLELTVPVRLAVGDEADACAAAEVWYGDQRVAADQVHASLSGPPGHQRLRIEARAPVNEPVVTVLVRAGCRDRIARQFTVLPEAPSAEMRAAAFFPRAPVLAHELAGRVPEPAQAAGAAPAPALALRPARAARVNAQAPSPSSAGGGARRAVLKAPMAAGGARLKLEPWEPPPASFLRVSASLAEPAGDAAARAAAALLWQALSAEPQDLLRTSALLQTLEGELAQLRRASSQTRDEMAALRAQLEAPQPWLLSPQVAQLLALLLLLAAAAVAVLWWRDRRAEQRWYLASEPSGYTADGELAAAPSAPVPAAAPVVLRTGADGAAAAAPAVAGDGDDVLDFDLAADAAPAEPAARRSPLRVETLAATIEEVGFLSSLSLWGDATQVLRTYLQDSVRPAPLAFYELMRLQARLEDKDGLGETRERYRRAFGVAPPKLDDIEAAAGLEGLPGLSESIQRTWGQPQVLEQIEQALFEVRPPEDALSSEAGRELLCLHDLAMTLQRDAAVPALAEREALAPWAWAEDAHEALAATQAVADGGASGLSGLALDVDLTEPASLEALPAAPSRLQPLPGLDVTDAADALELAPLLDELHAAAQRNAQERAAAGEPRPQDDDPFSAAVASLSVRRPGHR